MVLRSGCLFQHSAHSPEFSNFSFWSSLVSYITGSYLQLFFWGGFQPDKAVWQSGCPPWETTFPIRSSTHSWRSSISTQSVWKRGIRSFLTAAKFHTNASPMNCSTNWTWYCCMHAHECFCKCGLWFYCKLRFASFLILIIYSLSIFFESIIPAAAKNSLFFFPALLIFVKRKKK